MAAAGEDSGTKEDKRAEEEGQPLKKSDLEPDRDFPPNRTPG